MKVKMSKFRIFGLLALLTVSLSFVSCSDDGDKVKSFLETHGDTVWKFMAPFDGGSIYVQINDDATNPFEIWFSISEEACFIYESIEDDGSPEIIESSENKIVIKITESATEYVLITMTVSGNTLTILSEVFEDGELDDEERIILIKTTDNVDDLEICQL